MTVNASATSTCRRPRQRLGAALAEIDPLGQAFPGGEGRGLAEQIGVDVDVKDRVRAGGTAGDLAQRHTRAAADTALLVIDRIGIGSAAPLRRFFQK